MFTVYGMADSGNCYKVKLARMSGTLFGSMRASSRALAAGLFVALSGCAAVRVESAGDGIFELGEGKHLIKLTAISTLLSVEDMKEQARKDAEKFCERQRKRFRPLEDRSPPAIPAVAQIVFECAA